MVTCQFIEHDAPQLPVLLTVGLAHFNPRCFGELYSQKVRFHERGFAVLLLTLWFLIYAFGISFPLSS